MVCRCLLSFILFTLVTTTPAGQTETRAYVGFDRNDYPGDAALESLHKTFRYSSYWLNNPPGEKANSWTGKRTLLKEHGFGFLVLFNGRLEAQLRGQDAAALGAADGTAAIASAAKEGFPKNVLIFLDQEEGGRLTADQSAYIWAWVKKVQAAGARAGVYCSGIDVAEGNTTISTARDLLEQQKTHGPITLWVADDQCPPSPGCALSAESPTTLGLKHTAIWQYAQSPRRAEFSSGCLKNAAPDGNCYAPGLPSVFLDLNTATTSDPSGGR
jgi:hypothetical protein